MSGNEWFIHRFECPDCGLTIRADRVVKCSRCGSEVNHIERIGEVQDPVETDSDDFREVADVGGEDGE